MAAENKELMRQALEDVSPSVLVSVRDWLELGEIELGKIRSVYRQFLQLKALF